MRIDTNLISFHLERGSKGVRATYLTEMQKKGLCELCSPAPLLLHAPFISQETTALSDISGWLNAAAKAAAEL